MAGMDIVLRDKKGKIKQDYHVNRTKEKGKGITRETKSSHISDTSKN